MKFFLLSCLGILVFSCQEEETTSFSESVLIPKPQQLEVNEGTFSLTSETTLYAEEEFSVAVDFLRNFIEEGIGFTLPSAEKSEATMVVEKDASLPIEGYELKVSNNTISIKAADASGAFYAMQTLRQLLPPELEKKLSSEQKSIQIPQVEIEDAPAFPYRGMHLDVARHFFEVAFIKEYIANMALLKMNYFHWHLTDDQGWRIEIKQYPKLTTHAAFRNETLMGHYNSSPQLFDGTRYGGFYTQEEIKEVVAFAKAHNVTVIPEIEMPGHAQAAISAYPELGCTGEAVDVATKWGVFETIFCPKEETFVFLQNVLGEVMELFPGEYIHIGGDEAPKTQWKACSHCQKLIDSEGLKDENGLQSYFIKEMEAFVNSKGKKIIGWDEILEGGLAPNATVMSWRGTEGAVEAAKDGHQVILTPTSHAYFDYYQAEHKEEPLAIGGFLPLKKVYGFNPIPKELDEAQSKYVLGAQGNVWTEYMRTSLQVEYMAFPRMLAMSEVVWSGPSSNLEVEYPEFLSRVERFIPRLEALEINYANHIYDVEGEVIKKNDSVFYAVKTALPDKEIVYSEVQSSTQNTYKNPIPITGNVSYGFNTKITDTRAGRAHLVNIRFHKGVTGTVSINVEPHPAYSAGGTDALINGISGSRTRYGDKEWLGFWGDDLEIKIDLGEELKLTKISTRFYNAPGQWIYPPPKVGVRATLENKSLLNVVQSTVSSEKSTISKLEFDLRKKIGVKTRYVTLFIPNYGIIPEGLQGAGNKAWTFIDEIVIE